VSQRRLQSVPECIHQTTNNWENVQQLEKRVTQSSCRLSEMAADIRQIYELLEREQRRIPTSGTGWLPVSSASLSPSMTETSCLKVAKLVPVNS